MLVNLLLASVPVLAQSSLQAELLQAGEKSATDVFFMAATNVEPLEQECTLSCNENFQRLGQVRKNCTCTGDQCELTPDVPSACADISGLEMSESMIDKINMGRRGTPGCFPMELEHGTSNCNADHQKRSLCEHQCDDGFTLVGSSSHKCTCKRNGCSWRPFPFDTVGDSAAPLCKPAESVNFCPGLTQEQIPEGVTASCAEKDKYGKGTRCKISCSDPGQGFGGKVFDKTRFGSCACPNPSQCDWTMDLSQSCEDINECDKGDVCGENALCVNRSPGYECVCKCGFTMLDGTCVHQSRAEGDACQRGWTGARCNEPDTSKPFPCYYRPASIFRSASGSAN
ncbi:Oidioi.mRNA.OKI2018_I69.PAR.g12392.t1.cds [Oikopleura dioica]|uniref:Oidioi.mRNA.OKI2018_I69.PAR.g12392.t1.cds n=1 Tax=Oikopleura dioica TaxID=34765 RepID=A0ABN7S0B3_OIKDI|nr:Oidioi.mRNA.OKI2018_I69.PAR.g12392.t1.cds [Oikopleura dioica]